MPVCTFTDTSIGDYNEEIAVPPLLRDPVFGIYTVQLVSIIPIGTILYVIIVLSNWQTRFCALCLTFLKNMLRYIRSLTRAF